MFVLIHIERIHREDPNIAHTWRDDSMLVISRLLHLSVMRYFLYKLKYRELPRRVYNSWIAFSFTFYIYCLKLNMNCFRGWLTLLWASDDDITEQPLDRSRTTVICSMYVAMPYGLVYYIHNKVLRQPYDAWCRSSSHLNLFEHHFECSTRFASDINSTTI